MKMLCYKTKKETKKLRVSTSGVENIQDGCESSHEWTCQQIQPKVRLCRETAKSSRQLAW